MSENDWTVTRTHRGFEVVLFRDGNGNECSIQQSSAIRDSPITRNNEPLPGTSMLRLGRGDERMHLDRHMASQLMLLLSRWLAHGSLEAKGGGDVDGEHTAAEGA